MKQARQPIALKTAALVMTTAAAATLLIQACGGGGAIAQSAPDPFVGIWESVVTQRDCTTNATIATLRGNSVVHADGTFMDTPGAAPGSRGPGLGVWTASVASTYTVKFRFFRFNADGTPAGSNVVTRSVTLAADGNSATGTSKVQVLDVSGNTLAQGCSTDTSTRFK
jgi:hypothetical protein